MTRDPRRLAWILWLTCTRCIGGSKPLAEPAAPDAADVVDDRDDGEPQDTPTDDGSDPDGMTHGDDPMDVGDPPVEETPCTVFVAPGGDDDTGLGTEAAPFATLQRGVDAATPGTVVCAGEGVYPDSVTLSTSGTPEAPITLRNRPGETAVLEGLPAAILVSAGLPSELYGPRSVAAEVGWWVVEGLEIRATIDEGIALRGAHDVVIRGNHIHDVGEMGIWGDGARITIDANVIADNGWHQDADWCFPECDNKFHGIYCAGSEYTITNNVIAGNYAYGIQVAAYPCVQEDALCQVSPEYADARGWRIVNNVLAGQRTRSGIVVWQLGAVDAVIANNLFYDNAAGSGGVQGVSFYGCGGGHVLRNNLFFSSGGETAIGDTESTGGPSFQEVGRVEGDPLVVDAGGRDFHLQDGSAAIDTGSAADGPDHDRDGAPRPAGGGVDVGAYER